MSDYSDSNSDRKAREAEQKAMFFKLRRRVEMPIRMTPNGSWTWRTKSTILPRIVAEIIAETEGGPEFIEQGIADFEAFLDLKATLGGEDL